MAFIDAVVVGDVERADARGQQLDAVHQFFRMAAEMVDVEADADLLHREAVDHHGEFLRRVAEA